jgi:hypothetical protein
LTLHGHATLYAWLGLVVAVSGCVCVLALRRRSPRWYWVLIRYPFCLVRMLGTWRAFCVECGLTTARRTGRALLGDLVVKGEELRPRVPRLLVGPPTFRGLTARVRLLPGQTPEAYAQAVDAMGLRRVRSLRPSTSAPSTALRAQLGGRVCHHVADPETAVMTLGDVFPDAVDAAQLITAEQQGCAVTTDGEAGWLRARSTYTTPEEAADLARRYAHLTPALPGIGRPTGLEGGEN